MNPDLFAFSHNRARPVAGLGEALSVENGLRAGARHVARLVMSRRRGPESQIAGQPLADVVRDETHLLQRLDDLDVQRPDRLLHAVVAEHIRRADHELAGALAQRHEAVDDAEMRVDAETGDELAFSVTLIAVQDAAVVHVAVTGGEVRHRQGRLMNREFIQRDDHGRSVRGRAVSRLSDDGCLWRSAREW